MKRRASLSIVSLSSIVLIRLDELRNVQSVLIAFVKPSSISGDTLYT